MPFMELFRGDGRSIWQLRFTDHRGFRRQISSRAKSRSTALTIANKIELLVDYRIRTDALPADLVQWLQAIHRSIRDQLVFWEIIEKRSAAGGKPLYNDPRPVPPPADWKDPPEALVDFWELDLQEREVTDEYASESAQRVRVLLALPVSGLPPIRHLADVTPEGLLARVRELRKVGSPVSAGSRRKRRPASPQTCQHYLAKAREFFGWMISKGYATSNPAEKLEAYSQEVIRANRERQRRAFTAEEQALLLTATPGLKTRWKMTGYDRALLYRFALRTGLRAKEIRLLTVATFNFFSKTITLVAGNTKARRQDVLPIAAELVEPLRTHFAGKLPGASAFTQLGGESYCKMLKDDLEDLGIPYKDAMGRYADFHSLRHTYGTDLAKVVMPAVHQRLMRHSTIATTMKFYTHIDQADNAAGLAKLPALPVAEKKQEAAG